MLLDIRRLPLPLVGKPGTSGSAERIAGVIALIKQTVDRDSWPDNGGQVGAVRAMGARLVITQNKPNHKRIAELIKVLHPRAPRNRK